MAQKLFLTGKPGVGKTTVFQKVVQELRDDCVGFYTVELREDGERVGFDLVTVNIPCYAGGPLAHIGFNTEHAVGRYHVETHALEHILQLPDLFQGNKILIIDEIAPMEFFSPAFRPFLDRVLQSDRSVLATIKLDAHEAVDAVKTDYPHIPILTVTEENRDTMPNEILRLYRS